jgi:hypothetical protein
MAAATLMAASFHVVPTMAAESEAGSPAVQRAVLRAAVLRSSDAPVIAPLACVHRLAKPAVAPAAPVAVTPVAAPVAVALAAPQSMPAMAPPSPVAAPAPPAAAPVAPAAPAVAPSVAPATPTAPEVAPVAPAAPADAPEAPADKEKNKKKSSYVYRMTGPDGNEVVIVNGKVRALTPEEQQEIEKAMEQFKNGDFAKHMADLQREMAELKIKDAFDSPEFREKMEAAQRELAQSAFVNNAELQARVQAMMKNFDKQNKYIGHCKDGVVKDKDKDKQKNPENPQNQ